MGAIWHPQAGLTTSVDWLRIGLAAILTTAITAAAFDFFLRRQKKREAKANDYEVSEKQRAQKIASGIGTLVIHILQACSGIAAAIPVFALGIVIIDPPESYPEPENVIIFLCMFVFGWIIFAWCLRIIDAVD